MKKMFLAALCATTAMSFADTANIDDFEDGDGVAFTGSEDYWISYTDVGDNGASSYTNAKKTDGNEGVVLVMPTAAAGGSQYGAGLTGIVLNKGENQWDPYVALGLKIANGLNKCTTIKYNFKGAAHNLKVTMKGDENGALTEQNKHKKAVNGSSDWTPVSIPVSSLAQESDWGTKVSLDMAKAAQIDWEVKKEASADHIYIDDVECVGYDPSASTSSTTTSSTAVDVDNFDDGNTTAEALGSTAYWYIYTSNGGEVGNTQDANQSWDLIVKDGENSYAAMKQIKGITSGDTKYPSVGMEVAFDMGVLSGCTALQYDYKGSGHHMRASVDGVKADKGYEHVATDQSASTDWKTVTVSTMTQPSWVNSKDGDPESVQPFSWAKVSKFAWVVDEKLTAANIGTELAIDNVKCVGTLGTATPTSSNSNTDSSDSKSNKDKSDAIGTVASVSGLNATIHGNTLQVSVAKAGLVKVQVFDMMGHAIESHSENMTAGSFAHSFGNMSKGAYIIRVQQGSMMKTIRMQVR